MSLEFTTEIDGWVQVIRLNNEGTALKRKSERRLRNRAYKHVFGRRLNIFEHQAIEDCIELIKVTPSQQNRFIDVEEASCKVTIFRGAVHEVFGFSEPVHSQFVRLTGSEWEDHSISEAHPGSVAIIEFRGSPARKPN